MLSSTSCSSDETAPIFEALFKNLDNGVGSEDECVTFQEYSAKLNYQDIDYAFDVYSGKDCLLKNRLVKSRLAAEGMLAGEWQGFIVIDNGTGADSRSISLFDPNKKTNHVQFDYVDSPVFNKDNIVFFSSTGKAPKKSECVGQEHQYEEWEKLQLAVGFAVKNQYDLKSNEASLLVGSKCIPIE